eukprot:g5836.t1
MNEKHGILKRGDRVVDLGASPGGWSKVARDIVGAQGSVIAVDLLDMPEGPPAGVQFVRGDAFDEAVLTEVVWLCGGKVDAVLSDMAPNTSGSAWVDHARIMELCHDAHLFARANLRGGGSFLCKIFRGEDEQELREALLEDFERVVVIKPKSSRKDSSEAFMLARNYRP